MTRKEIATATVAVLAASAMVVVVALTLLKSEDYAKYLPLVVFLSGMAGVALYFVAEEEESE